MTLQSPKYFDGDLAKPRKARVTLAQETHQLVIEVEGLGTVLWNTKDVRRVPDVAGRDIVVLSNVGDPVPRLVMGQTSLLISLPHLDRPAAPKGRSRLVGWGLGAVAAVALQVLVLIPIMADQLAEFIPPKGERALGDATFSQIRSALSETNLPPVGLCEGADGLAALEVMRDKLVGDMDLPHELSIHVLDHKMVNAFALPGGYVVFFRGLLDAAETPEELAAVFAHEVGHVVSRDPTRHALRSAGSIGILGLLFGDFAGGAVVLLLAERLIDAQYSQGAEAGADRFAYDVLLNADVSPDALGTMFERLKTKYGESDGFVAHFMAHPTLGDRIEASRAAVPAGRTFKPLLSDDEWAALQRICR